MRRITLAFLGTLSLLVLLFSYRTSLGNGVSALPAQQAHVVTGGGSSTAATGSGGSGPDPSTAAGAGTPVVADGSVENTPHGPVQVRVTVQGGRITDVSALQYPTGERRSVQINAVALPQLRTEVIDAQGARVSAISGATETTEGYTASLQAALDAAHFGA